jgi:hypothetical protein
MRKARVIFVLSWLLSVGLSSLLAQDDFTEGSKLNTNLGFTFGVPLNPTARFVTYSWGFVAGAGYNFNRRNALIGEIMWDRFHVDDGALAPLRTIAQADGLNGKASLIALTGNYRYELRGNSGGIYFIAGGGGYFWHTSLSQEVASGVGTTCDPSWLWWGYTCTTGVVDVNQTITSKTTSALGVNGGVGFTTRVGEPPYRLYVESRYHYIPHKDLNSQFVIVTFGVRF